MQNQQNELPTLDDYNRLVQAYNELKSGAETQARLLREAQEALGVRDEALKRQGEDLKQTMAEVAFLKAVANQQQKESEKRKELSVEELQDRYMRLQAEMENLRRRWEQRAASDTAEARRAILRDMLPLTDHLEMALQHGAELEGDKAKSFVANIEATQRAFLESLRRYGVEPMQAEGAEFDPNLHEAIGQVPLANAPAGIASGRVAHVVQRGYMEGESLLRPARVLVAGE
jgi:molecular chaperone GrpE